MYIGIDLGTSNSSIAYYKDGKVINANTADNESVLPSVIYINQAGNRLFGHRAYQQTFLDPKNIISGFKRLMGTSTPIQLASGLEITPEIASSEIIKVLLSQIDTPIEDITGCIVTIPAAFNQMQSEATLRAAKKAGLVNVALLQEPIAASMAAVAEQPQSGLFLIYDLGGGTFDVALVQSVAGNLNILDNLGINMLGGRDFDHSILTNHVIPELKLQYQLSDDFYRNPKYQQLIRISQLAIEKAKIELSERDSTIILADPAIIATQDEKGNEIYLEIPLSRNQLQDLTKSHVEESIELCHQIIKKNGYNTTNISSIIFIGGPSKMPWLREMISSSLNINVDFSIDPMTAVSAGAAIYAESRNWGETQTTRKQIKSQTKAVGLDIHFDYPSRVTRENTRIKVISAESLLNQYEIQIDSHLGWTSGRIHIKNTETEVRIPVLDKGDNHYRISVFDASGQLQSDASTILCITRVYASVSGIPATHTISAKVVEETETGLNNILEPVIEKGTLLPTQGTKKFRAARVIHAGEDEHIDLELFQQESTEDKPEDCLAVGAFRIKGQDLLPGMVIRRGDEIICQWSMNDSGILQVVIDVPMIGQSFNTGHMYVDSVGHRNFDKQSGQELVDASLEDTTKALENATNILDDDDKNSLSEAGKSLQDQRRLLATSSQPEDMRRITENLRAIRQKISATVNAPKNKIRVEQAKFDSNKKNFQKLYDNYDISEETKTRVATLEKNIENELAQNNDKSLSEAAKLNNELMNIYSDEMLSQAVVVAHIFRSQVDKRGQALDKNLHDRLVKEGYEALENQDKYALRRIINQITSNFIEQTDIVSSTDELSGLMRG